MRKVLLALAATLCAVPQPGAAQIYNEQRAINNYIMIANGRRKLEDLSRIEQREVREVDRLVRGEPRRKPESREACIEDEIAREGGSVSYLHSRIIDLRCSQR
ncbi:hypothetical protein B2G71_14695 [Novosphingobium sp. PC22D]|uniref:hypothetical protein n=1 Tax=Novosphingobium sp. PC22D TaxID=1962403 RepID=UPI000BF0B21B|nr:hypothetical protein [Novosphingobium sp. PC22D]PEQ12022.1 hypothetical protein B2G71_14695 [Novosphingobium sp. PC22D]